ncbi:hypothetical protein [Campylobacter hyointestinalis]|uniref:hypothetical protein n=1 Tax=Campylobacter hyointestinalis TaxID=198 RepID=UPI000DCD7739|nr:hypothetical protein [Campylobacter hyointestinalis]RAZ50414.1 hypothetical protein CHL9004_01570 [Campylobacter hyointestinalis subsp. lawsonii]
MVERSFGVLQGAGLRHVSGYVGNLAKRAAIEESLAEKKDRHAKDEYGYDKATNHKHLYAFSQFKKIYETEIMKWDLMGGRRRKGKASPLQIWNSDETPITRVAYTEYLLHAGVGYERSVNKSVVIEWQESSSGEIKSLRAGSGEPSYKMRIAEPKSDSEAFSRANAKLNDLLKGGVSGKCRVAGANIVCGGSVSFKNSGASDIDGRVFGIKSVSHNLNSSGYTIEVEFER